MADINGDDGPNIIPDTIGNDFINAMGGDDNITVTYGLDFVFGASGNDTLRILWGDAGQDIEVVASTQNGFVDTGSDDFAGSARRVSWQFTEHLDVTAGSGNDILHGYMNQYDIFDGGAGVDKWLDSFVDVTGPFSIDMSQMSSAASIYQNRRQTDRTCSGTFEPALASTYP